MNSENKDSNENFYCKSFLQISNSKDVKDD